MAVVAGQGWLVSFHQLEVPSWQVTELNGSQPRHNAQPENISEEKMLQLLMTTSDVCSLRAPEAVKDTGAHPVHLCWCCAQTAPPGRANWCPAPGRTRGCWLAGAAGHCSAAVGYG